MIVAILAMKPIARVLKVNSVVIPAIAYQTVSDATLIPIALTRLMKWVVHKQTAAKSKVMHQFKFFLF